jgi:hypothetical protein
MNDARGAGIAPPAPERKRLRFKRCFPDDGRRKPEYGQFAPENLFSTNGLISAAHLSPIQNEQKTGERPAQMREMGDVVPGKLIDA